MIVTVSGIKRSGSTLQYNIVRLILIEMGYHVTICGDHFIDRPLRNNEVDLIKIHPFDRKLANAADHIFLTMRNKHEIRKSMCNFYGIMPTWDEIEDMQEHLNLWTKGNNAHLIHYDTFKDDKSLLIEFVKHVLGAKVDSKKILKQFNEISLPETGQDEETLFFHNHIGG